MQQYVTNTEPHLYSAALAHGMRTGAAEAILNHKDQIYIMRVAKLEDRGLDPPGNTRKPARGFILPDVLYMREKQTLLLLKLKQICMPEFPPFTKAIK